MPDITFIEPDGSEHGLEAPAGVSLMQVATGAGIKGIVADCGGQARCATCHVYVDAAFEGKTGEKSAMEESMLDFAENVEPNSRLSCQIKVTDDLDGLIVRLPESQH